MHRNAPLTPEGRLRLCERIEGGWPVAHAAESMGISRDRAYVWCTATGKKVSRDWRTGRVGPTVAPARRRRVSSAGS